MHQTLKCHTFSAQKNNKPQNFCIFAGIIFFDYFLFYATKPTNRIFVFIFGACVAM